MAATAYYDTAEETRTSAVNNDAYWCRSVKYPYGWSVHPLPQNIFASADPAFFAITDDFGDLVSV